MMSNAALKRELGKVATALEENLSDEEMDRVLAERPEEIETLLEEVRGTRTVATKRRWSAFTSSFGVCGKISIPAARRGFVTCR
jgi:hypothetical protein